MNLFVGIDGNATAKVSERIRLVFVDTDGTLFEYSSTIDDLIELYAVSGATEKYATQLKMIEKARADIKDASDAETSESMEASENQ